MTYTEVKKRIGRRYFYRVRSTRNGKKFKKIRIYLGKDLSKAQLSIKEIEADSRLNPEKKLKVLNKIILKIREILKKNKIKRAGIFGSYARGGAKKNSDIDILIEPTKNMGFKFAGLEIQLRKALKKRVDLVSYNGISPYLKDKILSREVRII